MVDRADSLCAKVGYLPLSASTDGITLRGGLRHRSFLAHVTEGYEPHLRRLIAERLQPGWTFVDAGAHIGIHTVAASRQVGPTGHVVALEPDPYNFRALRHNTRDLGNVEIVQAAVGTEIGLATFRRSRGTISSSLVSRPEIDLLDTFDVQTIAIDNVVDGGRVLVKLDVEGAELLAIKGMGTTAANAEDLVVICEVNLSALEAAGSSPMSLVDALEALGLTVSYIADDQLIPARDAVLVKGNLFCERSI